MPMWIVFNSVGLTWNKWRLRLFQPPIVK